MDIRLEGYKFLKGHGLEIGALNAPARLPPSCFVEYADVQSKEEAIENFPELKPENLVDVDYICDLDKNGLNQFTSNNFDFLIFNHVIEHVANPIKTIGDIFRIVRIGGILIISAPDKNYTFDKPRDLTTFSHLKNEYRQGITEVSDAHYLDFLKGVHPGVFATQNLQDHIDGVRKRREHAHVWDSESFKYFLTQSFKILKIRAICLFESTGEQNGLEYFSVWEKVSRLKFWHTILTHKILKPRKSSRHDGI